MFDLKKTIGVQSTDIEYRDILTRSREGMESILFHNMVSAVSMVSAVAMAGAEQIEITFGKRAIL